MTKQKTKKTSQNLLNQCPNMELNGGKEDAFPLKLRANKK